MERRQFVLVPAPDEILAPLVLGDFTQPIRGRNRERAERISVEIDGALRQPESLQRDCQPIGCVESLGVFECHGSTLEV